MIEPGHFLIPFISDCLFLLTLLSNFNLIPVTPFRPIWFRCKIKVSHNHPPHLQKKTSKNKPNVNTGFYWLHFPRVPRWYFSMGLCWRRESYILADMWWYHNVVLISFSVMVNDIKYLFIHDYWSLGLTLYWSEFKCFFFS